MPLNPQLIKGKKWLFAGHNDQDSMEGGMINYRGAMSFQEAKEHVAKFEFDWAHLVEIRFGEPHIVVWLNGDVEDGWVMPSEVTDDDLR